MHAQLGFRTQPSLVRSRAKKKKTELGHLPSFPTVHGLFFSSRSVTDCDIRTGAQAHEQTPLVALVGFCSNFV